jgi:hypothetical protein
VELFAIDANTTVTWNWAIANTPMDLIATLDYLVRSTPTYIICNVEIKTILFKTINFTFSTSVEQTFPPLPVNYD